MPTTSFTPADFNSAPGTAEMARQDAILVNVGTAAAPDLKIVRGVENIVTSDNPEWTDSSDRDGGGYRSNFVAMRQVKATVTIHRKLYNGQYDAAQEKLRLAARTGEQVECLFVDRTGVNREATKIVCAVTWTDNGGGLTDKRTITVELNGQGAPTYPVSPVAAPTP